MAEDLILYLYVDSILRTGIVSDNLTSAKSNSELVRSLESLLEHSLACPKHPSAALPSTSCSSPATLFEGVPSLTQTSKADEECEAVPSWSYIPPPPQPKSTTSSQPAYVTIPAQDAMHQEPAVAFPETREALDVTAKFFYLPPSDYQPGSTPSSSSSSSSSMYDSLDPAWINDSLEQLRIATGLTEVDTFIISFPGLTFDGKTSEDCCDDQNARLNGNSDSSTALVSPDDEVVRQSILKVWKEASANKHLLSLGVSEFSLERLQWLLDQAKSETSSSSSTQENDKGGRAGTTGITSTRFRKPRVCQINTRNHCDIPAELVNFAKEEDVELLVHADCSDFLPPRTFTRLLARHGSRLPPPLTHRGALDIDSFSPKGKHQTLAPSAKTAATASSSIHARLNGSSSTASAAAGQDQEEEEARNVLKALSARWVLKYTVLIRDRALVADKGYIVKASRNAS
ncbi:hypothetical protein P389DRAFT_172800 [Cystobasidium minutum MCA 4210]|uniref:uncharacterized protein n=1 Tax=Cystobasidium minutum MCA 4210 TaxID=1397322 RepID=UPI0034CF4045|eukprot:jgi/Rhomi1/172800/fgenesh1_kg.5_\